MKRAILATRRMAFGFLVAGLVGGIHLADAQQARPGAEPTGPIAIRRVQFSAEGTPEYAVKGARQTSGRAKNWLRVTCEYDSSPAWLDEATFTYYVLLKGASRDVPPFTLLRGEVTYINIEQGRRRMSDMFVHPDILSRYGAVERVAVVVRVGGRVVGMDGRPAVESRWWEQLSPVDGLVMNRMQTPFAFIDVDDFPMIKP
ncbi:MAG TPA: hypothetical protein PKE55_02465 [Kiritimatiellia bacterium]|nr:hypothetical protein [Kiritimatiellia bacterium]